MTKQEFMVYYGFSCQDMDFIALALKIFNGAIVKIYIIPAYN